MITKNYFILLRWYKKDLEFLRISNLKTVRQFTFKLIHCHFLLCVAFIALPCGRQVENTYLLIITWFCKDKGNTVLPQSSSALELLRPCTRHTLTRKKKPQRSELARDTPHAQLELVWAMPPHQRKRVLTCCLFGAGRFRPLSWVPERTDNRAPRCRCTFLWTNGLSSFGGDDHHTIIRAIQT